MTVTKTTVDENAIDTSDASQVRERRRTVRNREERFLRALKVVLNSTEGRTLLWRLLEDSEIFEEALRSDGKQTAYVLGRQAWGRKIFALLMEPERLSFYAKMVEENSK